MPQELIVTGSGEIRFIHSDQLAGLASQGKTTISRASHVEPYTDSDGNIRWEADLSPVNGPKFNGFTTRQEALDAEVQWLKENNIPVAGNGTGTDGTVNSVPVHPTPVPSQNDVDSDESELAV